MKFWKLLNYAESSAAPLYTLRKRCGKCGMPWVCQNQRSRWHSMGLLSFWNRLIKNTTSGLRERAARVHKWERCSWSQRPANSISKLNHRNLKLSNVQAMPEIGKNHDRPRQRVGCVKGNERWSMGTVGRANPVYEQPKRLIVIRV